MLELEKVIARKPPLGSLLKAFLLINLGLWPIGAMAAVAMSKQDFFDRSDPVLFWIRLGMLAVGALLALGMLVLVLRVVSRWLMSRAGVVIKEKEVELFVPRLSSWLSPVLKLDEKTVPLAAIRGTRFSASTASALTVETDSGAIEIPPGVFAVSTYAIEAGLRRAAGGQLAPEEPIKEWRVSSRVRVAALVIMAVLLLGPVAVIAVTAALGVQDDTPAIIAGVTLALGALVSLCLVFLLAASRGRVFYDSRGVFHERGGKLSFAPWDMLDQGGVSIPPRPIGAGLIWMLWTSLDIKTRSGLFKRPACRIQLSRFAGLGWPLQEIMDTLHREIAARGSPPQQPAQ